MSQATINKVRKTIKFYCCWHLLRLKKRDIKQKDIKTEGIKNEDIIEEDEKPELEEIDEPVFVCEKDMEDIVFVKESTTVESKRSVDIKEERKVDSKRSVAVIHFNNHSKKIKRE